MSYQIDWNIPIDCISKESLLKKLNGESNFILIDTIGTFDGNKYRIKGATTIPYPNVADRRSELLVYDEIIIYCSNKRCKASKKAAAALKMLNVPNVKIYEGGLEEWKANDLPLEEY
jgi:rhodanese-related sulfurtransferase